MAQVLYEGRLGSKLKSLDKKGTYLVGIVSIRVVANRIEAHWSCQCQFKLVTCCCRLSTCRFRSTTCRIRSATCPFWLATCAFCLSSSICLNKVNINSSPIYNCLRHLTNNFIKTMAFGLNGSS